MSDSYWAWRAASPPELFGEPDEDEYGTDCDECGKPIDGGAVTELEYEIGPGIVNGEGWVQIEVTAFQTCPHCGHEHELGSWIKGPAKAGEIASSEEIPF